ncbi:MAG TPA: DUF1080 domain-containing protein [Prolixibacteraceae bacterium]
MKNFILLLIATIFVVGGCKIGKKKSGDDSLSDKKTLESVACCEKGPVNQLTDAEKAQDWLLMFDGKTSGGWRGYNKTNFPAAWVVEDGTLKCRGEESRGDTGKVDGGDIVFSKRLFSDFDLRLEWKISKAGNSGIFYLGREVAGWPIYKSGLEMQIIDNELNPDSNRGRDGNRKAGSLYDLLPANPQNARPAGEWNSIEIICYQGKVVHRQNGVKVLEYELWTPEWKTIVNKSKFPGLNPDWENVAKEGLIALQDHGNDVWFRNIKIRAL